MPSTDLTADQPLHPTCVEVTTPTQLAGGFRSYVCGRDCPRPAGPDAARDARRRVYTEGMRRAASRALDRYLTRWLDEDPEEEPVTSLSEQFVESMGDYVEARALDRLFAPCGDVYGADPRYVCGQQIGHDGPHEYDDAHRGPAELQHNRHYGVPLQVTDESAVHVAHLHEYDGAPCLKIECHELGSGDYCTWCGGQPCRVRMGGLR